MTGARQERYMPNPFASQEADTRSGRSNFFGENVSHCWANQNKNAAIQKYRGVFGVFGCGGRI